MFESFARESETAASAPEAYDVTEAELTREILADERERLFGQSGHLTDQTPVEAKADDVPAVSTASRDPSPDVPSPRHPLLPPAYRLPLPSPRAVTPADCPTGGGQIRRPVAARGCAPAGGTRTTKHHAASHQFCGGRPEAVSRFYPNALTDLADVGRPDRRQRCSDCFR